MCVYGIVAELICLLCLASFLVSKFAAKEFQFKLDFGQLVNGMWLGILSLHQNIGQVNTMSNAVLILRLTLAAYNLWYIYWLVWSVRHTPTHPQAHRHSTGLQTESSIEIFGCTAGV